MREELSRNIGLTYLEDVNLLVEEEDETVEYIEAEIINDESVQGRTTVQLYRNVLRKRGIKPMDNGKFQPVSVQMEQSGDAGKQFDYVQKYESIKNTAILMILGNEANDNDDILYTLVN